MTRNEITRRFPKASEAFIRSNITHGPDGLSSWPESEPTQGPPLVSHIQGKGKSKACTPERYHIHFLVYSTQPRDWDNLAASIKQLQDCLVEAGWLPDDNYKVLSGTVSSLKCKTKAEHRTEITLTRVS